MEREQLTEYDFPLRVDGLKIFTRRGRRILTAIDVQMAKAVTERLNRMSDFVTIPRLHLGNPNV